METKAPRRPGNLAEHVETLRVSDGSIRSARLAALKQFRHARADAGNAAATRGRRTAKVGSRDNRVMWFGQAIELKDGLDLCDVAFAGAQHAGGLYLQWQNEAATALLSRNPRACLDFVDLFREILRDDVKHRYLFELGGFVRWQRLSSKYWSEHREFEASKHGRETAAWRSGDITKNQLYLIGRIASLLSDDEAARLPIPANRGAAHDFIRDAGGNPRFAKAPDHPSLPPPSAKTLQRSQSPQLRLEI